MTRSDPSAAALIVVDVQNEYDDGALPIAWPPFDTALRNITRAMDAATAAGVAVVVVRQDGPGAPAPFAPGSDGWQLHPQVAAFPADHHINKSMGSAFAGTDLRAWLENHNIDTLTVTGYMTHNCDAATIYHAAHDGLQVEFLQDASGTLPYANAGGTASAEEIHRVFCAVFHSNFAAVASTRDWLAAVREGKPLEKDNIYLSNQRARKAQAN